MLPSDPVVQTLPYGVRVHASGTRSFGAFVTTEWTAVLLETVGSYLDSAEVRRLFRRGPSRSLIAGVHRLIAAGRLPRELVLFDACIIVRRQEARLTPSYLAARDRFLAWPTPETYAPLEALERALWDLGSEN